MIYFKTVEKWVVGLCLSTIKKKVIEGLIDKGKMILDKYRDEELHSEFKILVMMKYLLWWNTCYDEILVMIILPIK